MSKFGIPVRNGLSVGITAGMGSLSLSALAQAILRSFGANASEYPFSTLQGAYQTNAGPAAVAVSDPIGLELDAMGTVGPELVTVTPVFTSLDASFVASGVGATLTATGNGVLAGYFTSVGGVIVGGSTYTITITLSSYTSGAISLLFFGGTTESQQIASTTTFTIKVDASATGVCYIRSTVAGTTLSIASISVKEVTGNHATQTTAGSRPLLAQDDGGRWYAAFDGVNDSLALSSVPFQMADDFVVVACVNCSSSAALDPILTIAGTTAKIQLAVSGVTGFATAVWIDDALTTVTLLGVVDLRGSLIVVSLKKVGNVKVLRVNGVQIASDSTAMGAATFTNQNIGTDGVIFLNGAAYDIDLIKGTVTDAQLLTLEKAAAQRAGLVI